jgi:hypothetical protein
MSWRYMLIGRRKMKEEFMLMADGLCKPAWPWRVSLAIGVAFRRALLSSAPHFTCNKHDKPTIPPDRAARQYIRLLPDGTDRRMSIRRE